MSTLAPTQDWQRLAIDSHYQLAVAISEELRDGNVNEALAGLEELIEAMSESRRRAMRSQLIRLMMHVLKWKSQPERRTGSWAGSIYESRDEIEAIQEEMPSLSDEYVRSVWAACFSKAKRRARAETQKKIESTDLTWQEVFEDDFFVDL